MEFSTAAGVLNLASADGVQVIQLRADADAAAPAAIPAWALADGAVAVEGEGVAGVVSATQNDKSTTSPQ